MASQGSDLARLAQLIEKGEAVLETHKPNPPNVIGFPTLDSGAFSGWQAQAIYFLQVLLGLDSVYVKQFQSKVSRGHISSVRSGIEILKVVREDMAGGNIGDAQVYEPALAIKKICDRFHLVVRQIRSRHESRPTLDVQDEYDVQDLLHSLLWVEFDDVRAEEFIPSYGGKASRIDFLIKAERVVVEVKKTRARLDAKVLSTQLIDDIERYRSHPDCGTLVCFVYDPEGLIANPRGVEADLSRNEPYRVTVLIRP